MNEILNNLKNKSLAIKIPFIVVVFLVIYMISNLILNFINQRNLDSEIASFRLDVKRVYFETRFNLRNFMDKYLIVELNTEITKEQFQKLKIEIPNESISADLLPDKKIKVTFNTPFKKGISSNLLISYLGKRVYNFNFKHSEMDEEDSKKNPINEPDKY
ncbi:MAG: hypothetical protein EBV07_00730 [Proteobacteria bacterium]|nr:hypothetical protein [Pseudomonadota bacterium]